jgi:hypothetical protein
LSINIQTDGDMNYSPGILWTAVHSKIPLLSIMHNNRGYHQERMYVQMVANKRDRGIDRSHIGTSFTDPFINYAKMAETYGMYSEGPISDPKDLGPALARALDPERRVAILSDESEMPYDLFLGVPKHRVPDVVEASGMTEKGWVPVDISEANRNPELKEYYFGNLTEDRVRFTTGRDIAERAARRLKRVSLELGGKNGVVVLADADLDLAVIRLALPPPAWRLRHRQCPLRRPKIKNQTGPTSPGTIGTAELPSAAGLSRTS